MIKTDKVIYHTKTREEFDWLMEKLQEANCEWLEGWTPVGGKKVCGPSEPDSYIWVEDYIISFSDKDFFYAYYNNNLGTNLYEVIEVSDLMEEETNTQDKTEEETDAIEELEAIHKQVTSQIADLRKQGKEPKAIEYTIKVCFE